MRTEELWLLILCWADIAQANGSLEELQLFLTDNGHGYVDVFHNSYSTGYAFIPNGIFFSRQSLRSLRTQNRTRDNSFGIFFFDNDMDNLEEFLAVIEKRRIRKSLLFFTKPQNYLSELNRILTKIELRTFFYVAVAGAIKGKILSWHQVISLSSSYVIENLKFYASSYLILETFNLNGLKVTSTTLTWAPYYTIENCNEYGLDCDTSEAIPLVRCGAFLLRFCCILVFKKRSKIAEPQGTGILLQFLAQAFK